MWTLLLWVQGCAGINCDPPDFEMRRFTNEQDCYSSLMVWQKVSKDHIGICYQTDNPPQKIEVWREQGKQ